MTLALKEQVGGSHYKQNPIQPLLLSYLIANGDACFVKLLKYVARGKEESDLPKAAHMCRLAKELLEHPLTNFAPNGNTAVAIAAIAAFTSQYDEEEFLTDIVVQFYTANYNKAEELILYLIEAREA